MGAHAIKVIFVVVALGVLLFFARSGVISKLSFPVNPFSLSTSSRPTYSWQSESSQSVVSPSKWTPADGSQTQPSYNAPSTISLQDIPKGFTASQISPDFHKIRIGSVSPGSVFYYGQISLFASFSGPNVIDVTGWYFKANKGSQFVPKAVEIYDPSGLASAGEIYLGSGDMLNIYSTQSAIGENLRMNKCIGYLENYNHFTPPLPLSCPYIDRSEISGFTGVCQNLITSIGSCSLPPANPLLSSTDYSCKQFLSTINYKGCFEKHRNDKDFLGREWRAWAGSRFLDPSHDNILLFDRQGLLVDTYSY